jgi:hypothetical protein
MAEIFGDNTVLESVKDCLKSLMDNLKTAMDSAGTDPRPTAIYDGHEQSAMTFPALSVGIADDGIAVIGSDIGRSAGTATIPMNIICEIRIHTDYDGEGRFVDRTKVWRLINSVSNYIKTNAQSYLEANLTGFLALRLEPSAASIEYLGFDESLTVGGKYNFVIQVVFNHTQV